MGMTRASRHQASAAGADKCETARGGSTRVTANFCQRRAVSIGQDVDLKHVPDGRPVSQAIHGVFRQQSQLWRTNVQLISVHARRE
jgi:hypothetical protein